jgi:hypothetical protein
MMAAAIFAGSPGDSTRPLAKYGAHLTRRRLVVGRHARRHLQVAAELGPRAAGLDDGHADVEHRDVLAQRIHEALDPPLRRVVT